VKAFVTGATGFVGSAVVRHLLSRGITVRVLARRRSDLRNIAGLDVEIAYGDLLDEPGLLAALRGCDTLFHVAAFYSTSEADSQQMYEVNVRGTKTVLRAAQAAGVARIVHTSTIGTVGQPGDSTLATEETPFDLWDTASHYTKSKYLAEIAALTLCQHGAPVVIVNPCAPVGGAAARCVWACAAQTPPGARPLAAASPKHGWQGHSPRGADRRPFQGHPRAGFAADAARGSFQRSGGLVSGKRLCCSEVI